jgi:hypothetical protein
MFRDCSSALSPPGSACLYATRLTPHTPLAQHSQDEFGKYGKIIKVRTRDKTHTLRLVSAKDANAFFVCANVSVVGVLWSKGCLLGG